MDAAASSMYCTVQHIRQTTISPDGSLVPPDEPSHEIGIAGIVVLRLIDTCCGSRKGHYVQQRVRERNLSRTIRACVSGRFHRYF